MVFTTILEKDVSPHFKCFYSVKLSFIVMLSKVYFLFLLLLFCSCSNKQNYCGIYIEEGSVVDTIDVNPHDVLVERLDTNQYKISEVIPFVLPEKEKIIDPVMVKRCGGYIYVMSKDAKSGNVINVFDNKGVFLCAIGERGHAKNEYIDSPTCFSFDYTNGDIHVYERASNRFLVFDKLGKFKREVKFDGGFPNSACVTESGNYLCSFNERQNDSYDRLALYDKNGKRIKVFLPIGQNESLSFVNTLVFSDKSVCCYYHPFYDLCTIVKNDKLNNFIKFDFMGEFLSTEIAEEAIADNSIQTAIEKHNGVIMIESVEITDTLIHMDYLYKNQLCHFVYDKCKKKCYNNNGSFFAGIWPSFYFCIDGDQLMFVVTEDDINKIVQTIDTKKGDGQRWYNNSHSIIRKIIDKKIKAPVFLSVKIS